MKNNIFKTIPDELPEEIFSELLNSRHFRIERIVSRGHCSPKDYWYDQTENEWIIVLQGKAKLLFEDNRLVELNVGDYLNISAHQKHRIEWTDPTIETVWLAVFYC